MVLAVLAIVPLVLMRIHDVEGERAERFDAAARHARELAQNGADEQNELLATTRAFLQVIARSHAKLAANTASCSEFLANLSTSLPWTRALSVSGLDGRIVCSNLADAVGLDISDRVHFQNAVRTGEFAVSEYVLGRRMPGPIMAAAFPQVGSDGRVEAVAGAVLDLAWIRRRANTAAERMGAVVLLVDGKGSVIARYPEPEAWVGRQFPDHALIRQLLARSEGTTTAAGLDGVRRIFGFVQLPASDARFAVGLDENAVLGRVNGAMLNSYAQLAVIAALVLIAIWFGGERLFVQPIHALTAMARRFARGEFAVRPAEAPWAAEFTPLVAAFDDMAGQIAAREHKLRQTNGQLEVLAQHDGLTGLANRRTFDVRLELEWKAAALARRPIALLMIDIDYFKLMNDHYGHLAGDNCLRRLAKVFANAVRQRSDLAARYGGEEFALLLPGANLDAAGKIAERVRGAVEALSMVHAAVPAGHVTVSIGVASFCPEDNITPQALIQTADIGLYEAKRCGRNTVVAHGRADVVAA
jgi:diguanylate cyclase (GGDEF)-like protein